METALTRVLELLVLPPGSVVLLLALGLALLHRHARTAVSLLIAGLIVLYVSSIPATATALLGLLETHAALPDPDLSSPQAEAIVVLGSSRYPGAPEYGGDTVSRHTLERVRYAVWLHRRTGLPVLASGGDPLGEGGPEAPLMARVLREEFDVDPVWVEDRSRNTFENARYSAAILGEKSIRRVYLVTHAWHMPRALDAFRRAGLEAVPAPTAFHRPTALEQGVYAWLPDARALLKTRVALHELLGRAWYRIRYPD